MAPAMLNSSLRPHIWDTLEDIVRALVAAPMALHLLGGWRCRQIRALEIPPAPLRLDESNLPHLITSSDAYLRLRNDRSEKASAPL